MAISSKQRLPSCFSYDAELHLVHYNSEYDNIGDAVASGETDALSVVGILIKEVEDYDQFNVQGGNSVETILA